MSSLSIKKPLSRLHHLSGLFHKDERAKHSAKARLRLADCLSEELRFQLFQGGRVEAALHNMRSCKRRGRIRAEDGGDL
jgi:hypothetical protein